MDKFGFVLFVFDCKLYILNTVLHASLEIGCLSSREHSLWQIQDLETRREVGHWVSNKYPPNPIHPRKAKEPHSRKSLQFRSWD